MYKYEELKEKLFTDEGQRMFLSIRDNTNSLIKKAGAVRLQEAISGAIGDSWLMMACIDRMVELEELRELPIKGPAQYRIFVDG